MDPSTSKRVSSTDPSTKKPKKSIDGYVTKGQAARYAALGVFVGAFSVLLALQGGPVYNQILRDVYRSPADLDLASSTVDPNVIQVKTELSAKLVSDHLMKEEENDESDESKKQSVSAPHIAPTPQEAGDEPWADLVEWIISRGGAVNNIEVVTYDEASSHRGIHATHDIEAGEAILEIPEDCILHYAKARNSEIGQLIEKYAMIDDTSKHIYIACFLVTERSLGKESAWYPYIRMLPTSFPHLPVNFDKDEIAMMEGSYALSRYESDISSLHEDYELLSEKVPGFSKISFEDFKWGCSVVFTRVFAIPNGLSTSVLPVGDLLNHQVDYDVNWDYKSDRNSAIFNAVKPVSKGARLSVSYGKHGNDQLLSHYGFALPDNESNEAVIYIGLRNNDPLQAKKFPLAHNPAAEFYRLFFKLSASPEHPSFQAALKMCRLVVATEEDLQFLPKGGDHLPFSVENEREALLFFQGEAEEALLEFPQTIQFDEKALQDDNLTINQRNIILTRLGEKQALLDMVNFVDLVLPFLEIDDPKAFDVLRKKIEYRPFEHYLRDLLNIQRTKPSMALVPVVDA